MVHQWLTLLTMLINKWQALAAAKSWLCFQVNHSTCCAEYSKLQSPGASANGPIDPSYWLIILSIITQARRLREHTLPSFTLALSLSDGAFRCHCWCTSWHLLFCNRFLRTLQKGVSSKLFGFPEGYCCVPIIFWCLMERYDRKHQ